MITKAQIKRVQSLRFKKYRNQHGLFIAEGPKIIDEIQDSGYKIHSIFLTEKGLASLSSTFPEGLITLVSEKELGRLSLLDSPNHCLALVYLPLSDSGFLQKTDDWLLAVDGLQNPGNLGTIIRTADWFGIEHIVCAPDTVDAFNPKVVQGSMGSLFHLSIHYETLEDFFATTNKPVFSLSAGGTNLFEAKIQGPGIIVVGREASGIRTSVQSYVDQVLSIPGYGKAESLNAAIATAIGLSHIRYKGDIMKVQGLKH